MLRTSGALSPGRLASWRGICSRTLSTTPESTPAVSLFSGESYTAILARLERTYGREQDVDRLLIRKLYKLPKLVDLTHDNLVHMVTVIEAALPALSRQTPEELKTPEGVLNLLPAHDADMFYMHCDINSNVPNLLSFARYLTFRCQARKARLPLPTEKPSAPKTLRPKPKVFYTRDDVPQEDGDSEEDEQNELLFLTNSKPKERPPCSLCEDARHDLTYCPKFKLLDINSKRNAVDTAKVRSGCLMPSHFIKDCRRKKRCTHEGCPRSHHPLLYDDYQMRINYFDKVQGGTMCPRPSDDDAGQ